MRASDRTSLVRVRRMLGVYDGGRIISPKLADSQAIGGMVGSISAALLEHTVTAPRAGRCRYRTAGSEGTCMRRSWTSSTCPCP
ncbi:molybdopterin cofactor-binding domain-containing protein [Nonomuraea turcica]|uniref:molybdopterin cofactor-binding domain-containing protein n=1 Tax=Nonomuraea sp. G32 TaxID=3067274 RepID=UPI00273A7C2D|nr:molybdopterin cofactor-binding domain-containing protein [Nonomuraea sp. G32]MDP4502538.1 molybdopterin-dependent oxidoreductase [Nonomuraea sp. G32]